jgi:metallo-beta-lactamase class B
VLLDVPLEENVDRIEAGIRALGFDPADVRIVVASQAHFDHVGGVATFVERHDAQVVLSEADARMTSRGGVGPGADRTAYRAFQADRIVAHLDRVRIGDVELTAHLTPGHTPGCTSWSGRVTVDGRPVTWLSVCSLGVLPSYALVGPDETYPGIAADFCRSLAHLRSVEVDLFLGAHASFFALNARREAIAGGDARALIAPDRYRRYLDRNAARLDSVLVTQGEPGGCPAVLARAGQDDRAAIAAASRTFSDAYVRGDTATIRGLYTPDAVLLPPGREIRGRDAIVRLDMWHRVP